MGEQVNNGNRGLYCGSGLTKMEILIETLSGQELFIEVRPTDTVSALKGRIWNKTKIAPRYQGLIWNGHSLSCDEVKLKDYGLKSGSRIRLVLLTRSGPLYYKPVVNKKGEEAVEDGQQASCSSQQAHSSNNPIADEAAKVVGWGRRSGDDRATTSGDDDSNATSFLDLTLTEHMQKLCKQKADENLRTMHKMREIRHNIMARQKKVSFLMISGIYFSIHD